MQIEIVGFSAEAPRWTDAEYAELRRILRWLCDKFAVPYAFPVRFAAAGRADRLLWQEWEPLSGILGHEHAPYNDHTDPGELDAGRLLEPGAVEYVTRREFDAWRALVAAAILGDDTLGGYREA